MKPIPIACALAVSLSLGAQAETPSTAAAAAAPAAQAEAANLPLYVGSAACRDCHDGAEHGNQYVIWLRSRHGHAYWRLAADWALYLGRLRPQYRDLEEPTDDDRCRLCHVTGARDEGARFADSFRAEEGVGCESCHGPGSDYTSPEIMADREAFLAHGGRLPDEATCRACHRRPENFDWDEWWPKVEHRRPAAELATNPHE